MLDDDELLAQLADVLDEESPVPAEALIAARAAFALHRLDEEFAELLFDSADVPAPAGLRGPPAWPRQLTYQVGDLLIECEVDATGLIGQVLPAMPVTLEVMTSTGATRPVDVDSGGRFVAPLPGHGPIRLRCQPGQRRPVLTPWLLP
ncbi:MAG TPA: hypothetical protein VMU51_02190 [Mycobacteriales bacterium]|nr:hypothetical protein [Mycobacteriales bacterium]